MVEIESRRKSLFYVVAGAEGFSGDRELVYWDLILEIIRLTRNVIDSLRLTILGGDRAILRSS